MQVKILGSPIPVLLLAYLLYLGAATLSPFDFSMALSGEKTWYRLLTPVSSWAILRPATEKRRTLTIQMTVEHCAKRKPAPPLTLVARDPLWFD